MPYKIVRTFEKGKNMHWIAPSPWERNNIVKWPKHNALKFVKSANTLPQPDWRDIKCQVKRRNIPTYEEAERELDFLLANTDTDEETRVTNSKQASQKEEDLNVLMQQLYADQENSHVCGEPHNQPVFTVPDNSSSSVITVTNEVNDSSQIILTSSGDEILGTFCLMNEGQNNVAINVTQESSDVDKEKQDKMMATIIDNQKKMMLKMSSISVQIGNVQSQLNRFNETEVVSLGISKTRAENIPFSVAPINSIEELNKIEKVLSEKTAREQLKETYSIVCSGGKGINCAYTLIDLMFTRDFLRKCSWSGSSRSNGIKISLKCYKNVVSFFWEMIFFWDRTFTVQENEEFFKSVLKNSNKRKNDKLERSSTTQKRVKLDKKHKKKDDADKRLDKPEENKENVASSGCVVADSESINNKENNIADAAATSDIEKEATVAGRNEEESLY
ncbi:hypothetical protein evm_014121 [Chilo suppressalis]|nr:hypothetical protein evm_014121 [Chilo suppressalis]